ncbi:MAG: Flp pilus assembly protein CpaB [Chloroflexota bacterium]|nr:Flp pilus assembly protein CpaB [Chloroflexota bacterium]
MEMEFKDNSRRRTMVLVVGVLLALGAGAAAFMLSNQNADAPVETIPTIELVVAADLIEARQTIALTDVTLRSVPLDASNASAFTDPDLVAQKIAAIAIVANQPITPNMLESATGIGQINILEPNETVSPDSPVYRAVSLTVPADRAVGGLIGPSQRVDVFATMTFPASAPIDPETGQAATDSETGGPLPYIAGFSTKPMWLDVKVLQRTEGSDTYVMRMNMQQAEEVALAQIAGAQFSLVLRPGVDTRDIDRSTYGETVDRILTRYNFAIPESIDGTTYEQPVAYPSPFPAEPYLEAASPSPSPEDILIEIPVDAETESPAPEASLQP